MVGAGAEVEELQYVSRTPGPSARLAHAPAVLRLIRVRGMALMPWVRLHATKGYIYMIWLAGPMSLIHCTFILCRRC